MKPQFALSLSFDGIRLLLRAAGGWQVVGEVTVSSDTLTEDLAALRQQAFDLRPGRVRTKLIIPDDQIRYLSIETGDLDHDARIEAAKLALDGATPYPVDALAFDISPDGAMTHIAAIARETLTEAEAFASEHNFNPVSFVSAPADAGFLGEPYFGMTAKAKALIPEGKSVEPDGVRVVVTDPVVWPENNDKEADAPIADEAAPVQTDGPDTDAAERDTPGDTPDAPAPKTAKQPPDPAPQPQPQPEAAPPAATTAPEPEPAADTPPPKADTASEAPEDKPKAAKGVAALGFASRRGTPITAAAPLGGVTRGVTAPSIPVKPVPTPAPAPPVEPPKATTESLRPIEVPPEVVAPPPEPEPVADPKPAPSGGFLSRRKPRRTAKPEMAVAAATGGPNPAEAEAKRMTVFGAREAAPVGGKPRYLGLILMAVLLVFLAGVAAWASVFLDDGLARLFKGSDRTLASTLPDDTEAALVEDVGATTTAPDEAAADGVAVAALNDSLTDGLTAEDAAVLDALRDPLPEPQAPEELDAAALEARYAVTGIWPKAPEGAIAAEVISIDDLYITSIDPVSPALDAVALPPASSFASDTQLAVITSPVAAGTNFALDLNGRIIPTEEGAISPDGFTVFLGRPSVIPPPTPVRFANDPTETGTLDSLTQVRPRARPTDLVEQNERATLGGLSRSELASYRPQLRPQAPQEETPPETAEDTPPSALATALSLRPEPRPRNFERIVARATPQPSASAAAASTASVAPRTVTPAIPSTASVTREATVRNAISLNRVNLIGVYGKPSDRRALVRLSNGRFRKVQVGDRIDGGRVSAIGEGELRYQKGSRNLVLKMPKG